MTTENLFCKLYVDGPLDRADLLSMLQKASGGVVDGRTLYARTYELDVSRNDEFDPRQPENFLFFPFLIDIEPKIDAPRTEFVTDVGRLLQSLESSGIRAVASCDFEDELPRQASYLQR